jgi:hypothetical protein
MTDKELLAKWKRVRSLRTAVREMIVHSEFAASSDPYYKELTAGLWEMLERCAKSEGIVS